MNDICNEIYELLKSKNIQDDEILFTLEKVYYDLESKIWNVLNVNIDTLYTLKDIVWYNLEHLPNNGNAVGISNLNYLGKIFPNLLNFCSNENYVSRDKVKDLLEELLKIQECWDIHWRIVKLYSKYNLDYDNKSDLIIHLQNENPMKYGYCSNYGLLGLNGEKIKKYDEKTMLCCVENEIGEFQQGKIIYNLLLSLIQACNNCVSHNKGLKLNFNDTIINYQE